MDLQGAQKAAIFLMSLDQERAVKIVEQLDQRELLQIRAAVDSLNNIDDASLEKIYTEFAESFKSGPRLLLQGTRYLQELVRRAQGEEQATKIFTTPKALAAKAFAEEANDQKPLASLASLDPDVLRVALADEHPQVAAAVFSHIDPTMAAMVIGGMQPSQQSEIIRRIASLRTIPQTALADAASALGFLGLAEAAQEGEVDGITSAATILNEMAGTGATDLLGRLAEEHPEDAEKIQRAMFTFENLMDADTRGLQFLLREVQSDQLLVALKNAPEALKEKILSCMSKRASEILVEEMDLLPPMRLADVEQAQMQIAEVALRLIGEGKIHVKGRGEELV